MRAELAASFPARPGAASVTRWLAGPVCAAVDALVERANAPALAGLEVSWDLRGRMAGQARVVGHRVGLVRLNRQLFEYPAEGWLELRDTGLHEAAHLVVFAAFPGAQPHGRQWQAAARALGARPSATHGLPLARARARTEYAYRIDGQLVWLGAVRHRRLQAGRAHYRWRSPRGVLTIEPAAFTGEMRRAVDDPPSPGEPEEA